MLSQCRSETGSVPQCLHTSVLHRVSGSKIEFHAESTGFQFFQTEIRASDSDEEDALVRYFKNMFAFVFLVWRHNSQEQGHVSSDIMAVTHDRLFLWRDNSQE